MSKVKERPQDRKTTRYKTTRQKIMYITQILEYLIWPAFILLSWFTVKFALSVYEKKFGGKE
jgi:hypothetical protein